jgi:hypothetical protein
MRANDLYPNKNSQFGGHLETFPDGGLGEVRRAPFLAAMTIGAKPLDSPNMPSFLWSGIWKRFHTFTRRSETGALTVFAERSKVRRTA